MGTNERHESCRGQECENAEQPRPAPPRENRQSGGGACRGEALVGKPVPACVGDLSRIRKLAGSLEVVPREIVEEVIHGGEV
jgi:hypothetical protein